MIDLLKTLFRRLPLSPRIRGLIRKRLLDIFSGPKSRTGHRSPSGKVGQNLRSRDWPQAADELSPPAMWRVQPDCPLVIFRVGPGQELARAALQRLVETNAEGEEFYLCVLTTWPVGKRLRKDLKQLRIRGQCAWYSSFGRLLHFIAGHPGRDLVVLRSECLVPDGWLSRLRSVADRSGSSFATISPLTTGPGVTGYPLHKGIADPVLEIDWTSLDRLASRANGNQSRYDALPGPERHCTYLARRCFESLGWWGKRRLLLGRPPPGNHLLAPHLIVRKCAPRNSLGRFAGPSAEEPQRAFPSACLALDLARLRRSAGEDSVLFVTHGLGGGTELHVLDMARRLEKEGVSVFFLRPAAEHPQSVELSAVGTGPMSVLSRIDLERDSEILATALRELKIGFVHIHHMAGLSHQGIGLLMRFLRSRGLIYDLTLHDHMSICPRIVLVDGAGRYCGEPDAAGCRACISRHGSDFGAVDIVEWRTSWADILDGARNIYVPSRDLRDRIRRYFPSTSPIVKPHPMLETDKALLASRTGIEVCGRDNAPRRILVLGALVGHKGFDVVLSCARDARIRELPLEFVVIGFTADDHAARRAGMRVTGAFEPEELGGLVARERPFAIFFASTIPETYSYTLSTAFALGITPVAFDMGAIAERIRDAQFGHLLPLSLVEDAAGINNRLLTMEKNCDTPRLESAQEIVDLRTAYYGGLPSLP